MLFDGVGAQVALPVEVVCRADEEVAGDVREEAGVDAGEDAWEDTTVTDDESLTDEDVEDLAEVAGRLPGYLDREPIHQLHLHSWQQRIDERFLGGCYF